MGSEYIAVAFSTLSAGIGGLLLLVVNGIRGDIRELRAQTLENTKGIAALNGKLS